MNGIEKKKKKRQISIQCVEFQPRRVTYDHISEFLFFPLSAKNYIQLDLVIIQDWERKN